MNGIHETGAYTDLVNDLILFTDTTKELAELRDRIYTRFKPVKATRQRKLTEQGFIPMTATEWNTERLAKAFEVLLNKAWKQYHDEVDSWVCIHQESSRTATIENGKRQIEEYCLNYAERYPEWIAERARA